MLDPIVNFFTRIFHALGRGIGLLVAWIMWPFLAAGRWYARRGWLIKGPIGIFLILLFGLYVYFVWNTQSWTNFDPGYAAAYEFNERRNSAGVEVSGTPGTCSRSAIADVTADLIDLNVNENAWISSMITVSTPARTSRACEVSRRNRLSGVVMRTSLGALAKARRSAAGVSPERMDTVTSGAGRPRRSAA